LCNPPSENSATNPCGIEFNVMRPSHVPQDEESMSKQIGSSNDPTGKSLFSWNKIPSSLGNIFIINHPEFSTANNY
jgi:hypothetical protein